MSEEVDEPVRIAAYDSTWPVAFERERALLAPLLKPWLAGPIEHVGSTAVPGLPAKPVIDIMAGVRGLEDSAAAIGPLAELGYLYPAYRTDVMHWFCKPSPARRTHHLQLVPFGGDFWRDKLAFRDALRGSSQLAEEYAALKRRLAELHEFDREAYTGAKTPFVERVLGLIRHGT